MSSSDSSRVVTGIRSGKERQGVPLVAILAPIGKGGQGGAGWDWSLTWPESRGPGCKGDVWGLSHSYGSVLWKRIETQKTTLYT